MISGETIKLLTPRFDSTSKDGFNADSVIYDETEIKNVLVAPADTSDVDASNRPYGTSIKYNLYFPKTFSGELRNCDVVVRGERLSVIGEPSIYTDKNVPLKWNAHCMCGVVHG